MNTFLGSKVFHKSWGEGVVKDMRGNRMIVAFSVGEKVLAYPDAFEMGIVSVNNSEHAKKVETDIAAANERKRLEREAAERERCDKLKKIEEKKLQSLKALKIRQNIAFKCNYCDGGADQEKVGFCAVCSDEIIKNNIENRKYTECCREGNPCLQYYQGKCDRKALENVFTCYESTMLKEWKASAGVSVKGRPETICNAQINSLCVLTTRDPFDKDESERYIFGAFIIDEIFEGNDMNEGYVCASKNSPYKMSLTVEEAHKIRFWDFYKNRKHPEKERWGQGLFRYLTTQTAPKKADDDIAVSILKAIIEVKKGKKDEQFAIDFLQHFCAINGIAQK